MKAIGETKAIRIYPMKDSTYGIMWKIHPPELCLDEFDKEDWAKSNDELIAKLENIGKFMLSKK